MYRFLLICFPLTLVSPVLSHRIPKKRGDTGSYARVVRFLATDHGPYDRVLRRDTSLNPAKSHENMANNIAPSRKNGIWYERRVKEGPYMDQEFLGLDKDTWTVIGDNAKQ